MAEADRQQKAKLAGELHRSGRQPCPLPLRWTAPGAGGYRTCVPPHPPAAGQLAATRPSASVHGMSNQASDPRQSA